MLVLSGDEDAAMRTIISIFENYISSTMRNPVLLLVTDASVQQELNSRINDLVGSTIKPSDRCLVSFIQVPSSSIPDCFNASNTSKQWIFWMRVVLDKFGPLYGKDFYLRFFPGETMPVAPGDPFGATALSRYGFVSESTSACSPEMAERIAACLQTFDDGYNEVRELYPEVFPTALPMLEPHLNDVLQTLNATRCGAYYSGIELLNQGFLRRAGVLTFAQWLVTSGILKDAGFGVSRWLMLKYFGVTQTTQIFV